MKNEIPALNNDVTLTQIDLKKYPTETALNEQEISAIQREMGIVKRSTILMYRSRTEVDRS